MSLSQSEASLLDALRRLGGKADARSVASSTGLPESSVFPLSSLLEAKGYVRTSESMRRVVRLTGEGEYCAEMGLPETRLAKLLSSRGGEVSMDELGELGTLKPKELQAALGWGRRTGTFSVEKRGGKTRVALKADRASELEPVLKKLAAGGEPGAGEWEAVRQLQERGLVTVDAVKQLVMEVTPDGMAASGEVALNVLTSDLLKSGKWREVRLRPYDVSASPPSLSIGKKHPYLEFLEEVKEILIGMGFEEASSPYVESEFWNFDVLFQAQDHPARAVHDSFQVRGVAPSVDAPEALVRRVKAAHESGGDTGSRGWGYDWDIEVARRRLLRTQTTTSSVRYLWAHREPPVKAFCLSKVFRPDVIDSRHMVEFSQLDGIVGDPSINVRHLLGVLKEFASRLGFSEIKFTPGYFPFTEPSIEAYAKHPKLGWIECLGSGLFRPEVLEPLGIKFPVIAWGIGIDRLAMIRLGVSDIRDLNTSNLDRLRSWGWW